MGIRIKLLAVLAVFSVLIAASGADAPRKYDEPYRPQYHFSPLKNWTNDPNGLAYFDGEYHLFFQYNPFGDEWGHMSWGHAVSTDLLHWNELPVALPEENGIMIFTGSTADDKNNTSGFCTGGKPCLVAVYTGHTPESGGKPALQTQNLAYSNDRGRTWTKYAGNPVLNLHMADFRDPKVFWSAAGKRWVMAVSLPNEHQVAFYGSADLKSWRKLSDFGPAGATGGQWECPELFELPVEGGAGETRWVLKVGLNPGGLQGGSGEQYFVGKFDGTRFTNDNPSTLELWTDYGKDCYCALTFNGLPQSKGPVMLGWMNNWQYAAKLPEKPWRGQMTIPRKLTLQKTADGLRLAQSPIEDLGRLEKETVKWDATSVEEMNGKLSGAKALVGSQSFELQAEVKLGDAQKVGWRILAGDGKFTEIGYDRHRQIMFVDRKQSGLVDFSDKFPARTEAPMKLTSGTLRLKVLVDRNSVEVFGDDGRVALTNLVFPPANADGMKVYAEGGRTGPLTTRIAEIRSAH